MSHPHYRPDVDGLRAVAVLAVVLYHAQATWVPGGYVGVDIFFVISGFIITRVIAAEIDAGSFRLTDFYERRIRRIFPALFVVIWASLVFGWFLLLPENFENFAKSIVQASIFTVNFFFFDEAGYFGPTAAEQPLLHLWSLAIEEQFYVIFPLLLLAIARWWPGRRASILIGLSLASLIGAIVAVRYDVDLAFYLMPFRLWELALGALLAIGIVPALHGGAQHVTGMIGIAALTASIFGFSHETLFPGESALLPCLGAALVIHSGPQAVSGRLLSLKPLVAVGLISYAFYLWHWPLLVYAHYAKIDPLSGSEALSLVALAALLATLSLYLIERPIRDRNGIASRKTVFAGGFAAIAMTVGIGLWIDETDGMPDRLKPETLALLQSPDVAYGVARDRCRPPSGAYKKQAEAIAARAYRKVCFMGDETAAQDVLVFGDSHAIAFFPALDAAGREGGFGVTGVGKDNCPPAVGLTRYTGAPEAGCNAFIENTMQYIEMSKPKAVVIVARWPFYVEGSGIGQEPRSLMAFAREGVSGNPEEIRLGMARTIERIEEAGARVILVGPVPEIGVHVPSTLARSRMFGRPGTFAPKKADVAKRHAQSDAVLQSLAAEYELDLVAPTATLCDEDACRVTQDGVSLYSDDDHLSRYGATMLAPLFREALTQ